MGRRRRIWLLLLVSLVAIAAWLVLRSREPAYDGRSLTDWVQVYAADKNPYRPEYELAFHNFGTKGISVVIDTLARNDSSLRNKYRDLWPKMPALAKRVLPKPGPQLATDLAGRVFGFVGAPAIPMAVAALKHNSSQVREAAALGLWHLRMKSPEADRAIPALIAGLADSQILVRLRCAFALGAMGAGASNAVPALIMALHDSDVDTNKPSSWVFVRATAAGALAKIGPGAAQAVPTLETLLRDPDHYVRGQAAVALLRINPDHDKALPVLIEEFPGIRKYHTIDWILVLGDMGPRARPAVPVLTAELNNPDKPFHDCAVKALQQIDPEAAAKAGAK